MSKKDFNKKYRDHALTSSSGWGSFDGNSGSIVEAFLKDKLENSVVDFTYQFTDTENNGYGDQQLLGKNAFGEVVCSTQIINADPKYTVDCDINSVTIGSTKYTNSYSDATVNYSNTLTAEIDLKYIRTGNLMGNTFNDTSLQTITLEWFDEVGEKDNQAVSMTINITPGESVKHDISYMFKHALSNKLLGITYTDGQTYDTIYFKPRFNIKKLTLSYNNPYVIYTTTLSGFTLDGADNEFEGYEWQYCLDSTTVTKVPINNDINSLRFQLPSITEGAHNLYLRVVKGTLMSNWIPISFIYQTEDTKSARAIVTEIPDTINNCNMSRLFKVVTTNKISGNIEIVVLKSNSQNELSKVTTIESAKQSNYLFKEIYLSLLESDESTKLDYTSYIEIPNVNAATTYIKVFIKDDNSNTTTISNYFSLSSTGVIQYRPNKAISIVEPEGGSQHLQHIKGAILDFSQINNGNVFNTDELNSDLNISNGLQVESVKIDEQDLTLTTFKASPTSGVFKTPKLLKRTNGEPLSQGAFSVEMAFKTYGSNDFNDELLTIGNLTLCPKHLFLNYEPENASKPEDIVNASRADFRMGEIQHVLITYDPEYKPSTYEQMYDMFYSNNSIKYSQHATSFACLKIYVNGTINRVIGVNKNQLYNTNNLPLQIAPTKSNINLYVFRTYDRALSCSEVIQNYISYMPLLTSKTKYYEDNDILYTTNDFKVDQLTAKQHLIGTISMGKCINKFTSASNPNKTYKDRKVLLVAMPEGKLPPYYGNRKDDASVATLLVHYPDDTQHSGRLAPQSISKGKGVIKAQGSSAKKYMFHNTSYSKFDFTPESEFGNADYTPAQYYQMPNSDIKIEKLVGKVNYASSMQSHKQGATKLFHDGYMANPAHNTDWMNDGRKAVLEDDFLYFFVNVPEDKLTTLTWDDIDFEKCYFLGFQTWGSAKGDKPTSGYSNATPHYLMLEGADNNNSSANFKTPWASMQIWGNYNGGKWSSANSTKIQDYTQNPKDGLNYYHQFSGKHTNGSPDYLTGLLINDETIVFDPGTSKENSTDKRADAWDVDFGCTEGPGYYEKGDNPSDISGENLFFEFEDDAISSVNRFAEFYNLIYTFDFSSLRYVDGDIDVNDPNINGEDMSKYKLVCGEGVRIGGKSTNIGDVYRWEKAWEQGITDETQTARWVPAGLYHNGTDWEMLNVVDICNAYRNASIGNPESSEYNFFANKEYEQYRTSNKFIANEYSVSDLTQASELVIYQECMAEAFKIIVHHYMDVNDIAYHQAFIRLVAGTDNRAKNTYFQIVGDIYTDKYTTADGTEVSIEKIETESGDKKYGYFLNDTFTEVTINGESITKGDSFNTEGIKSHKAHYYKNTGKGDNKIRLYQDDLDTIFKTDNNGQQIKPYYLLEPPFNTNLEHLWGDLHSGFFYNFDLVFVEEVKNELKSLLEFSTGTSWPDVEGTKFEQYFLKVQKNIPSIAYNHQSEIYYETAQTVYAKNPTEFYKSLSNDGNHKSWKDFTNNQVVYPVSLSHGSCLESEVEYLRDRVLLLSTYVNGSKNVTNESISFAGGSAESGNKLVNIETDYTSFISYNYPNIGTGYVQKGNSLLKYDTIIDNLYYDSNMDYKKVSLIDGIVIPGEEVTLSLKYDMEALTLASQWSNTDLYKTVCIKSGTKFFNEFLNFPNASTVICQDSDYRINNTSNETLDIVDYLENIEHLVIQNASFGTRCLDFTGCNRLQNLILGTTTNNKYHEDDPNNYYAFEFDDVLNPGKTVQVQEANGSSGFEHVILPKSYNVKNVILPSCVKELYIDHYPKLNSFNFNDGTVLKKLTIDGRNNNGIITYILDHFINSSDTEYVEITNIPKDFCLSEDICIKLAQIATVKISGTVNIGQSSNDLTQISWKTKQMLVEKFGNISTGDLIFNFSSTDVSKFNHRSTATMSESGIIPLGLNMDGNNIPIVSYNNKNYLNITYTVSGSNNNVKIQNKYVPRLDIESGYNGSCTVTTTIQYWKGNVSSTYSFTTDVKIGFYVPNVGDFAYANGTFNSEYDNQLPLVGVVFYSEPISNSEGKEQYDVRVLSRSSITNLPMSPASYFIDLTGNSIAADRIGQQQKQYRSMLNVLGLDPADYYKSPYNTQVTIGGPVTYNHTLTALPTGEKDNQRQYLRLAQDFVTELNSRDFITIKYLEPTDAITYEGKNNFNLVMKEFDSLKTIKLGQETFEQENCIDFKCALFPAFLSAMYFIPNDLSDKGMDYFGLGNWYLPSAYEIERIVYYRIHSCMTNATDTQKYWNSTTPNTSDPGGKEHNVFKQTAFNNIDLLKYEANLISSTHSSEKGESYSYGYNSYDANSIGWMANCMNWNAVVRPGMDRNNTFFPVCRIELIKQ